MRCKRVIPLVFQFISRIKPFQYDVYKVALLGFPCIFVNTDSVYVDIKTVKIRVKGYAACMSTDTSFEQFVPTRLRC
jgi:hypothetical protein